MDIRTYQNTDRDAVSALWRHALPDNAPHNQPEMAIDRKLAVDPDLFLVAVNDGSVIGTVMGGYDGHRGWVYSLAVTPESRRSGVATALMDKLEDELRALGCMKINLQVRGSNAEVVEFYRTMGYDVEDRISMGKRLYDDADGLR